MQLWDYNIGDTVQDWYISKLSNGLYTLYNARSGKYLDVSGASTQSGANVQIWQNTGACAQQWAIVTNSNGYRLVSACSGKSLDIDGGNIANGTNVQIWDSNNSAAQRWYIDGLDANVPNGTYQLHAAASTLILPAIAVPMALMSNYGNLPEQAVNSGKLLASAITSTPSVAHNPANIWM